MFNSFCLTMIYIFQYITSYQCKTSREINYYYSLYVKYGVYTLANSAGNTLDIVFIIQ